MSFHCEHSTPVEFNGQQVCIADLPLQSKFGRMNMGKRLKAELDERGMKPVQLCALVPELDIGTLSAIYKRDSRGSKFAPDIALALGLELRWLLTGEGDKFSGATTAAAAPKAAQEISPHAFATSQDIAAAYAIATDEVKHIVESVLRMSAVAKPAAAPSAPPSDNPCLERGTQHPLLKNMTLRGVKTGDAQLPKRRKTDHA